MPRVMGWSESLMSTVKSWRAEWCPLLGRQLPADIFSYSVQPSKAAVEKWNTTTPLPDRDVLEQGVVGAFAPAQRGLLLLVVVEDDHVVGRQRLRRRRRGIPR